MSKLTEKTSKLFGVLDVSPMDLTIHDEISNMAITREKFIEQALDDFESPLIAFATRLLHDADRARDVVQDTFIRLCQQDISKIQKCLKSWLFTVCRNRALDLLRKDKNLHSLHEVGWKKFAGANLQPDENLIQEERYQKLMALLEGLSENQRDVILLKFQHELSYQEIHEITGLSTGNIGFLIHTALKRLRQNFPDELI
jgi:RNA polymerase sigma factor (sigma-70 family)